MDMSRYSRQILFDGIGETCQRLLIDSRVAVVGMGALGTVLANHMVRAGVGFVRIIDRDFVEASNLQRQMLYHEHHAEEGLPKAIAAAETLRKINSQVKIDPVVADLTWQNAEEHLADVDLVLDGTDNFQVRFLVNDVCIKHGIPWVYGGGVSAHGTSFPILPGETPCLHCLFDSAPAPGTTQTCDTAGVLGPIIHIIASYQAVEAMKILVGARDKVRRTMLSVSIWDYMTSSVDISHAKNPNCSCCGKKEFAFLEPQTSDQTTSLCGRQTIQISPSEPWDVDLPAMAERLKQSGKVEANKFLVRFYVTDDLRLVIFQDGRVLVQGTDDLSAARTLYAKYIGM